MPHRLKIGTRGSKLAITQCHWVQKRIVSALGYDPRRADEIAPLVIISTQGDRIQDRRLIEAGGKALFTKEIEAALLNKEIDIAVHSLKDMPSEEVDGLSLCAIPIREDPRDAFLSLKYHNLMDLPHGARLGTASLRRQAQALSVRPDLDIVMVRGNVDTRLGKLKNQDFDALLLAAAGLNRLGLRDEIKSYIDVEQYACAPGQGALAIQCRTDDLDQSWIRTLHHAISHIEVTAERGALEALEASCRTAVGAYALRWQRRETVDFPTQDTAKALGLKLGLDIRQEAGDKLILVHAQ
jgi:hydroxymethylbilane synthase